MTALAPRYLIPALLLVLCINCGLVPPLLWLLILFVPLAGVALLDFLQSKHALRRNYPHDMRERLNGAKSNAIDAIYCFVEPGQLLDAASSTPLAGHWHAASADSFKRVN